jgi:uncharacterized protein YndB with AHSA1/START domain
MNTQHNSHVEETFQTPISKVWNAFINPEIIKQYMFGTEVVSDWKVGSAIVWKREWEGKKYEEKGVILEIEPEEVTPYTYFSAMEGKNDSPENYHTITIVRTSLGDDTLVSLTQDNNESQEVMKKIVKTGKGFLKY